VPPRPLMEDFFFDGGSGKVVEAAWERDLRGRGEIPNGRRAMDTLPAGLKSTENQWMFDLPLAAIVSRDLPRGDSSMTSAEGPILLHSVRRSADTIETGFARNDGLVGTARAQFTRGVPRSYVAQWTRGIADAARRRVVRKDSSLIYSGTGADTAFAIPTGYWGIADYSMQELLVPTILAIPADGASRPFEIFRPYARHWDSGTIVVRPIPDGRRANCNSTASDCRSRRTGCCSSTMES